MDPRDRLNWILHVLNNVDYDRLSDWEKSFLESVEEQFKKKGALTDKQEAKLEQIYRERQGEENEI